MTGPSASQAIFADARTALQCELSQSAGQNSSDDAFAAWYLSNCFPFKSLTTLAAEATSLMKVERLYRHVAVIGYAADVTGLSQEERDALNWGLHWLAGREPFPEGNPMGFCTDAVALLGIALGVRVLKDDAVKAAVSSWTARFLPRSYAMSGVHDWQRCLFSAVSCLLGCPTLQMPDGSAVADVRVALRSKGLVADSDRALLEEDEVHSLTLIKDKAGEHIGLVRAAMRIAAFDWIQRSVPTAVPGRATVEDVCKVLRRVPDGLRRWTWEDKPRTPRRVGEARRWHIDNEYHVQNLLYFLLSPLLPDLRDEEYFPSVGQKHPRADLFIPSLKLIIEVKFIYERTSFADTVGEVGEDASLYLADASPYTRIVAFIWDDTRRTEEHGLLIRGLRQIEGVADAVVVSRPGAMELPSRPSRLVEARTPSE